MAEEPRSNYRHIPWRQYTLTAEQEPGSERSGTNPDGSEWRSRFSNVYGYIVSTMGADGDEMDFFAPYTDLEDGKHVYVIDQHLDGKFDEHKVMIGFDGPDEAATAYKSNYEDGWDGMKSITAMTGEQFDEWASKPQSGPASEYALIGSAADPQKTMPIGDSDKRLLSKEDLDRMVGKPGSNEWIKKSLAKVAETIPRVEYGDLMWNASTKTAWWTTSDSDSEETAQEAERKLKSVDGVEKVIVEAEGYPGRDEAGWEDIKYDKKKAPKVMADKQEPKPMSDTELWDQFNEHYAKYGRKSLTDASEYAFPKEKGWPLDEDHIEAAYKYYNAGAGEDKHSSEEWAHLGRMIIEHLERFGKGKFEMKSGKIEHTEKPKEMSDTWQNGFLDGMLLGPQSYQLSDSKLPNRKRLRMVATFADKRNLNNRVYTSAFIDAMVPKANEYANTEVRWGEEPHPIWDAERMDYITHVENNIWSMAQKDPWRVDRNHTLICDVEIDLETAKGQAVERMARRKENIPVSIRWGQAINRPVYKQIVDGRVCEIFDERMIPYVMPQVVDKVSNPAVVGAGKLVDSAGMPPMLDAIDYQLQLTDATLEGGATGSGTPLNSQEKKVDEAKQRELRNRIKDLRTRAKGLMDSAKRDKFLAVLADAEDMENGWSEDKRVDKLDSVDDSVAEMSKMDDEKKRDDLARKAMEDAKQEKADIAELVKAIADGDGSGVLDMKRFTDQEDRDYIAGRAQFCDKMAEAKTRLLDAASEIDRQHRNAKIQAEQTKIAVSEVTSRFEGLLSDSQRTQSVQVKLDEDDKAIANVQSAILDCYFAIDQGRGIKRFPKREQYAEDHWVKPMISRMGYDKPEARKGMADAARFSMMTEDEKKKNVALVPNIVRALRAMNDSETLGWAHSLTDIKGNVLTDTAITYTASNSTVLNQAWYAPTILKRIYWAMSSLQYMGGFLPGDIVPNKISIGQVARFMTVLRQEPTNWYGNDFNSLQVPEGSPPLPIVLNNDYQDWGITPRGLGMTLTKDNILEMMAGPFHMDMFALSSYNVMDSMSLNNDLLNYLEITTAAAEEYAVAISDESVSSDNITVSNTQDNLTYLATNVTNSRNQTTIQAVNAIAQIAPSGYSPAANAPGTIFATRPDSWGETISASNALFVPIVQPRVNQSMARTGTITDSTENPVTVKISGVTQVAGYLDPFTLGIGSYAGTTAAYAVDYANGKILFTEAAGVTTESTLALYYSYNSAVQFFQADGNPSGTTVSDWTNNAFTQLRQIAQASYKQNYIFPEVCLTGNELSAFLQSASIYYALFSPEGVKQDGTALEDEWGMNMGQRFHRTVAPVPHFANTAYNFMPHFSRYGCQTPLTMTGPHQLYDPQGSGLPIEASAFMGREFSVRFTPLAVDSNGVPVNLPYAPVLRFYAAAGFNNQGLTNVSN